jgi:predicted nucleic acid-binding protein
MSVVVSDTSPLRALGQLQLLHVLGPMYTTVVVPPAVTAELARTPSGLKPIDLSRFPFLQQRAPRDIRLVEQICERLDLGEAEAIALAVEMAADFILIDESLGRTVAKQYGLSAVGVVGVLAQAKLVGLVHEVRPLLDQLERELAFRLSDRVRQEGLRLAGEGD